MIDSSMLPDFIVEAAEHLEEMESSLLRLEQDYEDKEVMDEIFRSIHTIKGALNLSVLIGSRNCLINWKICLILSAGTNSP